MIKCLVCDFISDFLPIRCPKCGNTDLSKYIRVEDQINEEKHKKEKQEIDYLFTYGIKDPKILKGYIEHWLSTEIFILLSKGEPHMNFILNTGDLCIKTCLSDDIDPIVKTIPNYIGSISVEMKRETSEEKCRLYFFKKQLPEEKKYICCECKKEFNESELMPLGGSHICPKCYYTNV